MEVKKPFTFIPFTITQFAIVVKTPSKSLANIFGFLSS